MQLRRSSILGITLFLILISCQKKEVQLPLIEIPGVSEIQNHSSIWVFMKNEHGKILADLNKNNKIINTHWIYNIDKRLPMGQVVPILYKMQENKNKDSMHKKEGTYSYFSYADTKTKSISLLLFPTTKFVSDSIQLLQEYDQKPCWVVLELLEDEISFNNRRYALHEMADILNKNAQCDTQEQLKVLLKYTDETPYQSYLQAKVYLNANDIQFESIEYFDTVK